ncbi:hypothetical protein [Bradyrhizobium sp. BR 10289]|uniref:hypothetical protein n=1 Tax=Bradyrhizobium sp. BR 10289 TaxID=2749993 RepID=UPI001C6474CB|nr:hypothetical protein [Bradyrhizobium sp. BR 10289]MBW7970030.1 hypothetical protein [Bradyrhizobium sp. BR 10289]
MKATAIICTTVGALAAIGMATTMPAQARHWGPGWGPGLAGGLIAGAAIGAAASSAYAYAPGPGYATDDGYAYGGYAPGYHRWGRNRAYETYGVYDESQHGGQPSSERPY